MSGAREILEAARSASVVPAASFQLLSVLLDEEAGADEIEAVVRLDPDLAARLLRLANSSRFGAGGGARTLREAAVRVGNQHLFALALSSDGSAIRRGVIGYGLAEGALWERGLAIAIAAEEVARERGAADPAIAYVAGLLCDCGKLVIGPHLERARDELWRLVRRASFSFERAELAVLGVDHAAVSAELLGSWGLPDEVVEAVRHHHAPGGARDADARALADCVHVADVLCATLGIGVPLEGARYRIDEESLARLDVSPEGIERIVGAWIPVFEETREALQVPEERKAA